MADIAAVLGRLTQDELNELRSLGPSGHLTRRLTDAIDRAAGGPGAGRGYYVPNELFYLQSHFPTSPTGVSVPPEDPM